MAINPIAALFVFECGLVSGLISFAFFGGFLVGAGIGVALALALILVLTIIQSV